MEDEDDLIPHDPPDRPSFPEISPLAHLPPPSMLEAYERVVQGSARRILDRMERESDHRHYMERTKLEAGVSAQRRGQWFAFIIAFFGMGGGFALIWQGSNVVGLSVFIATLASLVAVFIYGRKREDDFLEKHLRQMKDLAKEMRTPFPEPEE